MKPLRNLAVLKRFQDEPSEYLGKQHRQNLKAIEDAFNFIGNNIKQIQDVLYTSNFVESAQVQSFSTGLSSNQTIFDISITTKGGLVQIFMGGYGPGPTNFGVSANGIGEFTLKRDDVTIWSYTTALAQESHPGFTTTDLPNAGKHRYILYGRLVSGLGNAILNYGKLIVKES